MQPPPIVTFDVVQTVALGGVALFLGYYLKRLLPALARYNIPAAVVGGLVVSLVMLAAWSRGVTLIGFDTSIRQPLQIAFFTTIGFGASLSLLRIGGPLVAFFFLLSTIAAVLQNVVGVTLANVMGQTPLLGVLAGSVTLTGGPATGLAFAPLFERAGIAGAESIAVAAAMMGIVSGGLIGGPLATGLIRRHRLPTRRGPVRRGSGPRRSRRRSRRRRAGRSDAEGRGRRGLRAAQEFRCDPGGDGAGRLGERLVERRLVHAARESAPASSRCRPTSVRCSSRRRSAISTT